MIIYFNLKNKKSKITFKIIFKFFCKFFKTKFIFFKKKIFFYIKKKYNLYLIRKKFKKKNIKKFFLISNRKFFYLYKKIYEKDIFIYIIKKYFFKKKKNIFFCNKITNISRIFFNFNKKINNISFGKVKKSYIDIFNKIFIKYKYNYNSYIKKKISSVSFCKFFNNINYCNFLSRLNLIKFLKINIFKKKIFKNFFIFLIFFKKICGKYKIKYKNYLYIYNFYKFKNIKKIIDKDILILNKKKIFYKILNKTFLIFKRFLKNHKL
ncbi:hypothetical protein ACT2CI_00080 [Candidatus Vidania fulgoroideorum]